MQLNTESASLCVYRDCPRYRHFRAVQSTPRLPYVLSGYMSENTVAVSSSRRYSTDLSVAKLLTGILEMKFQRFGLTSSTTPEINGIGKVYSVEISLLLETHAT